MLTELVDYDYYIDHYDEDSSIPESLFEKLSRDASSRINYFTCNRITKENLNNNIQNACCEVVELLYLQQKLIDSIDNTSEIASETVGPHSVNYVNKTSIKDKRILSKKELNQECYSICLKYLANTDLMYRGIV